VRLTAGVLLRSCPTNTVLTKQKEKNKEPHFVFENLEKAYNKEIYKFYDVRTVHFEMKFYNNQRNAQVFLFISLFTAALHVSGFFFKLIFKRHFVQIWQWF
jgi:hypothetical protein